MLAEPATSVDVSKLSPVQRMSRDIAMAAKTLTDGEARFLVDAYYTAQDDRKRTDNQVLALTKSGEPNSVIQWFSQQNSILENQIKRALDKYTDGHVMGAWMKKIHGIGPVISAGMLAHIRIEEAPTAGHIWRYAGLDPTVKWSTAENALSAIKAIEIPKGVNEAAYLYEHTARSFGRKVETLVRYTETKNDGTKRAFKKENLAKSLARIPFNRQLKTLCWKAGQSFMKFSGSDECFYGHLYQERKVSYIADNEQLRHEKIALDQALKVGKDTEAYKHYSVGKLPPAHIDARARRYAVKIFLSHLHAQWYRTHFGEEPPKPFAIAILGHAHEIDPPH